MKSFLVWLLMFLAGTCATANAQCINNAISITQQSTCACTGRPDYPGGCQNNEFGITRCVIASYYSCGRNGDQNCMIAYTETLPGQCGNGGDIVTHSSAANVWKFEWQRRRILGALSRDSSNRTSECVATTEAFRIWLTNELNRKPEKTVRGGA